MKISVKIFVLGSVLGCLAAASVYAQQPASNTTSTPASNPGGSSDTSLGEIARKLKAQKAKDQPPAKFFTNDNLPKEGTGVSATPGEKSSATPAPEKSGEPVKGHDAEYYRARQDKLEDQLTTDKRELEVLQQKLGQNNMQYYPDPNKTLLQEYSRDDINKLTADIDAKKQKVADDEKAIDDLRDQLRQEGGDPGWMR
jgi:predicted RNase H-like nuclease (RuvC/YqgF family)